MPVAARFDLKMDADEKAIVAKAAALLGTTMAGFVRVAAREKAQLLLDREARLTLRRDANGLEPVASSSRQGLIWWREMLEFCRARQRVRPSDRSSSVLTYENVIPPERRGT
jgi:hypothetical protein